MKGFRKRVIERGDIRDCDQRYDNADGLKRDEVNSAGANEQSEAAGNECVKEFCPGIVFSFKDCVEQRRAMEEKSKCDGHQGERDGEWQVQRRDSEVGCDGGGDSDDECEDTVGFCLS